jgi:hypothetical protein
MLLMYACCTANRLRERGRKLLSELMQGSSASSNYHTGTTTAANTNRRSWRGGDNSSNSSSSTANLTAAARELYNSTNSTATTTSSTYSSGGSAMFSPPPPHPGLRMKKPSLELPPQIPATAAAAAAVSSGSKHGKRRKSGSGSAIAAAFSPRRLMTAIGTKPYTATTAAASSTTASATGTAAMTSSKGAVPQGMHNEGYCARELLHRSESGSKGSMSGSGSTNSLQGLSASARRGQVYLPLNIITVNDICIVCIVTLFVLLEPLCK